MTTNVSTPTSSADPSGGSPLPDGPRLNVGSGPEVAEGWLNSDGSPRAGLAGRVPWRWVLAALGWGATERWPREVARIDATRRLPFRDGSVSVVYASHVLEHLYRDDALGFLREARRVLAPGGVCRAVVPDLDSIVRWYLEHRAAPPERREGASSDLLMGLLCVRSRTRRRGPGLLGLWRRLAEHDLHKWMYDAEGFLHLFREAGFDAARVRGHLASAIPVEALKRVEKEDRMAGGAGVCVEATR